MNRPKVRVGEYVCGFEQTRFPTLAEALAHMETARMALDARGSKLMEGTTRQVGWWLPEPPSKYDAPATPERTQRMRFFAGWTIRLAMVATVAFGGLMFTEADLGLFGACCAALLFGCGIGTIVGIFLAVAWFGP